MLWGINNLFTDELVRFQLKKVIPSMAPSNCLQCITKWCLLEGRCLAFISIHNMFDSYRYQCALTNHKSIQRKDLNANYTKDETSSHLIFHNFLHNSLQIMHLPKNIQLACVIPLNYTYVMTKICIRVGGFQS